MAETCTLISVEINAKQHRMRQTKLTFQNKLLAIVVFSCK